MGLAFTNNIRKHLIAIWLKENIICINTACIFFLNSAIICRIPAAVSWGFWHVCSDSLWRRLRRPVIPEGGWFRGQRGFLHILSSSIEDVSESLDGANAGFFFA